MTDGIKILNIEDVRSAILAVDNCSKKSQEEILQVKNYKKNFSIVRKIERETYFFIDRMKNKLELFFNKVTIPKTELKNTFFEISTLCTLIYEKMGEADTEVCTLENGMNYDKQKMIKDRQYSNKDGAKYVIAHYLKDFYLDIIKYVERLKGEKLDIITKDNEDATITEIQFENIETETFAEKNLFFLQGKNRSNESYMTKSEYKRLIEYTNYLFEKSKLPKNIAPVNSTHIRAGEIRYAFYLMTSEKYPNKDYPEFIFKFIEAVFPSLKSENIQNYKQTANYKKFKTRPQYWDDLMKR